MLLQNVFLVWTFFLLTLYGFVVFLGQIFLKFGWHDEQFASDRIVDFHHAKAHLFHLSDSHRLLPDQVLLTTIVMLLRMNQDQNRLIVDAGLQANPLEKMNMMLLRCWLIHFMISTIPYLIREAVTDG